MANIATSYKIIGPFSPKEFSDTTTLAATVNTAAGTLGESSDTNTLIDSVPFLMLGNVYIKLSWVVS